MRCPKCKGRWTLHLHHWGSQVTCRTGVYGGCGKEIRLKRTHGLRKRHRTDENGIKVGDIYLDCAYHPIICENVNGDDITGVSMVDGSRPRSCSISHCVVQKMTEEGASIIIAAWKHGGEREVMRLHGWTEEAIDDFMKNWREGEG